ncbi:MAG: hypothetical protein V1716_02825 [Candidatus Uhrbacteria bacterium]
MKKSKNLFGLTFGLFLAFFHLVWSLLVAFGLAKPLMDWVLMLHHIEFQYVIAPFNLGRAAMLIGFTFVVGYVYGWVLGFFWHRLAKK